MQKRVQKDEKLQIIYIEEFKNYQRINFHYITETKKICPPIILDTGFKILEEFMKANELFQEAPVIRYDMATIEQKHMARLIYYPREFSGFSRHPVSGDVIPYLNGYLLQIHYGIGITIDKVICKEGSFNIGVYDNYDKSKMRVL